MLIYLVITTILGLKSLFYSHFTDKETEMQRLSTLLANEKKKKSGFKHRWSQSESTLVTTTLQLSLITGQ